eukprot:gene40768-49717_t
MRRSLAWFFIISIGFAIIVELAAFQQSPLHSPRRQFLTRTLPLNIGKENYQKHLPCIYKHVDNVGEGNNRGISQLVRVIILFLRRLQFMFGLSSAPRGLQCSKELCELPFYLFINSKSGGQSGQRLLKNLKDTVRADFFCDLHSEEPRAKLRQIFETHGRKNGTEPIHIMCCGGDGTMRWIMDEARTLGGPMPSVETSPAASANQTQSSVLLTPNERQQVVFSLVPMGTGNDLFNHVNQVIRGMAREDGDAAAPLSLAQLLADSAEPASLAGV